MRKYLNKYILSGVSSCPAESLLGNRNTFMNEGVYVLELANGRYYIGKSNDIDRRISQHLLNGKDVQRRLAPETMGSPDWEAWERNETLHWMHHKGIKNVRGWLYTEPVFSEDLERHAFGQLCERYDLCRKCGRKGHFISQCCES